MKRLAIVLGVAGVSLSAVFVRYSTAPSLILAFYRMAFAALALLAPALLHHRAELRALQGRQVLLCLVSGVFLGLHFTCYFTALQYTSVASGVLLVDTEVFFVALASGLVLRQKLSARAWLAVGVTFLGSAVLALTDGAGGNGALLGDGIALAGAACMAVYTMIGTVCRRSLSTTVYTLLVYLSAALSVLLIALCRGVALTGYGAANYGMALAMAVFCTLLGHSVFSWGLKYLPPTFISSAKLLEPVFASLWAALLFAEIPGIGKVLGGAVVLAGVYLCGREILACPGENDKGKTLTGEQSGKADPV